MIHSLAGGRIGNEQYLDIAFVELLEGVNKGAKTYYKSIKNLAVEDIVLVSYNEEKIKAKVIRIDKNISSYSCPIPVRRLKEIIKKV